MVMVLYSLLNTSRSKIVIPSAILWVTFIDLHKLYGLVFSIKSNTITILDLFELRFDVVLGRVSYTLNLVAQVQYCGLHSASCLNCVTLENQVFFMTDCHHQEMYKIHTHY